MENSSDFKRTSSIEKGPVPVTPLANTDSKTSKQSEASSQRRDPRRMATIQDDDERLLARIGYKQVCHQRTFPIRGIYLTVGQELRREFNKWSTVSYAISILGVLGSVPATFGSPVNAGGPATAVWAWFIGSCMAMCIASSGTVSSDFVHSRSGTDCLLI